MHKNQIYRFAWDKTSNQPRPIAEHCLLGENWVRKHMTVDPNWSLEHIGDVYHKLSKALKTYYMWMGADDQYDRNKLAKKVKRFRTERHNGLSLLQRIRNPHNVELASILQDHKAMLRLYSDMPIHRIQENIDNRTFNMRKEYDRLDCKKQLLEKRLEEILKQKGSLEIRLHYEGDLHLQENEKIAQFKKKLNDTYIRLQAAQTINNTYKKMIQVLRYDANFYEKILESLIKDSEDQQNFILRILEIGRPAIRLFNKLNDGYKKRRDKYIKKARKVLQDIIINSKKLRKKPPIGSFVEGKGHVDIRKHYERASQSMRNLAINLSELEDTMKIIKEVTTTSKVKQALTTIKRQPYVTQSFKKQLTCNRENLRATTIKQKNSLVHISLLSNNYVHPLTQIEKDLADLKQEIEIEDKIEEEIIAKMKEKAKVYVVLRYALWGIHDIVNLINVSKRPKISIKYPNPHLKLPLLKFDMLTMTACPPQAFEVELEKLLKNIQTAVRKLMRTFASMTLDQETMERCSRSFGEQFFIPADMDDDDEFMASQFNDREYGRGRYRSYEYDDEEFTSKTWSEVPTRVKIKQKSAKIVDDIRRQTLLY